VPLTGLHGYTTATQRQQQWLSLLSGGLNGVAFSALLMPIAAYRIEQVDRYWVRPGWKVMTTNPAEIMGCMDGSSAGTQRPTHHLYPGCIAPRNATRRQASSPMLGVPQRTIQFLGFFSEQGVWLPLFFFLSQCSSNLKVLYWVVLGVS